ncbi:MULTISPECIES: SRPBCC family protein [Aeromicrobium]|uniref:SRPBCC family protein n=1 Tax=Aeromicrobium TaxID=2040 RepID=UPI0002E55251|nr:MULTISPECIES: SRPBCC family protein [Aeromicrobium]TCJ00132.1 polyketide cyclase [Aeromicrobium sp. IC_218]
MPDIDRTITVDADQQAVWDFLSDFTTTEQWDPPTQSTERVSGDGGVGTVYRNVSKLLGKETEVTYTVVVHEAPHRLELDGDAGSVKLHDTITIEQDGPRTTVRYVAEFHPQGAAKLVEPLLPLGLKKLGDDAAEQMEQCLRRL